MEFIMGILFWIGVCEIGLSFIGALTCANEPNKPLTFYRRLLFAGLVQLAIPLVYHLFK